MRIPAGEPLQADAGEPDSRLRPRFRRFSAAYFQADGDVFKRGFPRYERVRLKQIADAPVDAINLTAKDAAGPRALSHQPRGGVQERRLAAASRPDKRDELAVENAEIDIFNGSKSRLSRLFEAD